MRFTTEHQHDFCPQQSAGEKRTLYVLILTVTAMVVEIIAGTVYGSMALLADGWHMGTHAAAFCITLFAYRYARKHADSDKFSFGAGKVSVLGGYTSAIVLGVVALLMMVESIHRLLNPQTIHFNEAIMVAFIGLAVNVASIFLLGEHHHHDHDHSHGPSHSHSHGHSHDHSHVSSQKHSHGHFHDHAHEHNEHSKDHQHEHQQHEHKSGEKHHDHNLRAAYMHVLADALTSVLAIIALVFGKFYGWHWLDAVMGMVGAIVITKWTLGLMKQTSPVLLDESIDSQYKQQIADVLKPYADIKDMHVWKISGHHYSAALTLVAKQADFSIAEYKNLLSQFDKIHHLTIEVHPMS
ncbi:MULTISPECIES: cation diffusion facilitator family transporter [Shewanella]|uniref:cation diffusion facilitator family transporter n=1 Tax=Shewanella TaxID=22 RepID=UPI001BC0BDCD|nr:MULTISPECIES: cation diffusion facilitator family transporter [Shewanella]GIU49501.1 cation diffusion facilitator transporter [Shewanella sp. KT0246]